MRYSWQLRRKALHELLDNRHGRMRLRLQVLAAAAVLALLVAGPMLNGLPIPISDQAAQPASVPAAAGVDDHRKAVFEERRRRWEGRQSSRIAEGGEKP